MAENLNVASPERPIYDLGHRGEVDYTQIAHMLAMTPAQRWKRFQRWRPLLRRSAPMSPILDEIVTLLGQGQVENIIVGGVSAILQGAAVNTFDLDLCYRRTPENIARLVASLSPLNPRPRGFPPELPFHFDASTVQLGCNFTLVVNDEDLDLLGEMSAIGGYEDVIGRVSDMVVAGVNVKVLSLEDLIATKQAAGRDKDLVALPQLRATLDLKRQQASP
jgi:hypothetical protein